MRRHVFFKVAKILVLVALAVIVFGYGVMALWNWVVPPLTGWHVISFGQAIALLVLCRILFGGFRGHGGGGYWRQRMRDRFDQMPPEARERLRESLGRHCRAGEGPPEKSS